MIIPGMGDLLAFLLYMALIACAFVAAAAVLLAIVASI